MVTRVVCISVSCGHKKIWYTMEEAYNDTISQEPMLELRKGLAVGGCMSQEVAHDATSESGNNF